MAWFTRENDQPELTILRRRVELLERQVEALARFTGIDPNHLPSHVEPVDEEVRSLVDEGKLVEAIRVHRAHTGLDLLTAKREVDAVVHGRL